MAKIGGGACFEFALGEEIDFKQFNIPSRVSSYALREVWVTNVQMAWYEGKLEPDSDGDGLSDAVEEKGPSDPTAADTDGNGVGDGVEFAISGGTTPCLDPNCAPANAEPYTLCRPYQVEGAAPGTYRDQDGDLLNDCEEELLETDLRNPDTNYDYVPDFLAFVNGINLSEATHLGQVDTDVDGVTDYQELKHGSPLNFDNAKLPGLIPVQYTQEETSSTATQQCYKYKVRDLPYNRDTDLVRIYLVESPKLQVPLRLMRIVERQVGDGITVNNEDFRYTDCAMEPGNCD
jgi:hypothetical protein